MRLTRAGEYGIRCVLDLARHGKGTLVSRKEIAVRTDVPPHFLAKIAQQLARAGIIEILQGANGGYRLLNDPADITLLSVIEAVIGEISLNDCVGRPESCHNSSALRRPPGLEQGQPAAPAHPARDKLRRHGRGRGLLPHLFPWPAATNCAHDGKNNLTMANASIYNKEDTGVVFVRKGEGAHGCTAQTAILLLSRRLPLHGGGPHPVEDHPPEAAHHVCRSQAVFLSQLSCNQFQHRTATGPGMCWRILPELRPAR